MAPRAVQRRRGTRQPQRRQSATSALSTPFPTSTSTSTFRSALSIVISAALAAAIMRLLMTTVDSIKSRSSSVTTLQIPHPSLAVCVAVRDSPENVIEWINYHRAPAIGVEKFYLMVTDDPDVGVLRDALRPFIATSVVELYDLPYVNPRTVSQLQVNLYARCLDAVRDKHDFIGFWDVDEYIVPRPGDVSVPPFRAFLADQDVMNSGGVALNWRIVGPSGHETKPTSGSVLENYRMCTPWDYAENEEIKSIVRTSHAVRPLSDPHTFEYEEGYHAIDPEKRHVQGGRNPEGAKDPRYGLYHFVTKSREEYQEKMRRGSAMGNRKGMDYFEMLQRIARVECLR